MIPRTTVDIGDKELEAVERVLKSGQFVKGKEAQLLEEEFASLQGVKFAATVNSGTSALHLSLLALGVHQGDEVILPPNTFAATVNAVIIAGGIPIFSDINPETFSLDSESVKEKITDKTKVIIPVHLYGLISNMDSISEIANNRNIAILEDACQSHGAEYKGKRAGSFGDLAAFSFFPTKNATVAGDGGIVVSNNEQLIEKIKALRDHGRIKGQHAIAGLNNRLSEILAAIGRSHLSKLEHFNEHRRKIAKVYNDNLKDLPGIILPYELEESKHVYHLYTIKTDRRDELKNYLKDKGIGSKVMYPERLNDLDYVKKVTKYQEMPVNDKVSKQILSLPISGSLELSLIEKVCSEIINFYT